MAGRAALHAALALCAALSTAAADAATPLSRHRSRVHARRTAEGYSSSGKAGKAYASKTTGGYGEEEGTMSKSKTSKTSKSKSAKMSKSKAGGFDLEDLYDLMSMSMSNDSVMTDVSSDLAAEAEAAMGEAALVEAGLEEFWEAALEQAASEEAAEEAVEEATADPTPAPVPEDDDDEEEDLVEAIVAPGGPTDFPTPFPDASESSGSASNDFALLVSPVPEAPIVDLTEEGVLDDLDPDAAAAGSESEPIVLTQSLPNGSSAGRYSRTSLLVSAICGTLAYNALC